MADKRLYPQGIKPSTTEGDVLTTVGGVTTWRAPAEAADYLVTVVDGQPGLVFDNDGSLVTTRTPA